MSGVFKKLFDKGKCLLGFHQGEWSYKHPALCLQTRICTRCKTKEKRTQHEWGDWAFRAEKDCTQMRTCARCAATDERMQHQWHPPQYKTKDSCEQISLCARCGEETTHSRPTHRWGAWQESDDRLTRRCTRCGEQEVQARPIPQIPLQTAAPPPINVAPEPRPPAQPKSEANSDRRLVGHWRHTNAMSSGGFSLVTDTHWILAEDGSCSRYSHQASGMGENYSPERIGRWQASNGVLQIEDGDGGVEEHPYQLDGRNLFLPRQSHLRLWERV